MATSKPLMARLQLPRFLTSGDRATVSVTVQNETGAEIETAPALRMDGEPLPNAAAQVVPPGASRRFDWQIEATGLAPIVLTAHVEAGSFQDAVRREIPVFDYGSPVWLTRAGKTLDTETILRFELPERRREGSAELVLQLAPSLSGALLDATPYLVRYPYGCVEQTLSRFLPAAMVAKVLTEQGMTAEEATRAVNRRIEEGMLGFLPRETSEPLGSLDEVTREGLARLLEMQTAEGGWGWWPGSRGNLYMTAYVTWGLSLGLEIGLDVDPSALRRARAFLANGLIEVREDPDLLAWTLHALVGGDLAEPQAEFTGDAIEWLWERHPRLTSYGRALFAMALHRQGMVERARLLVANLSNGVLYDDGGSRLDSSGPKGAAATASWGARNDWRRWSRSPVESTAFALMALMEIAPQSDLIDPAATWLLNNRTGARWGHTKETAIALLALSEYAASAPVVPTPWEYEALWNGQSISAVTVDPENLIRGEIRLQLEDTEIGSGVQELTLRRSADGAPLYYAAQLRYFDQSISILPQSSEIAIQRSYARQRTVETLLDGLKTEWERIDEGTPLAVGDIVECVLTVEAKNDLEYLLFESPKAAGMEPLERQSGYRSMRRVPLGEVDQFTRRILGSSGAYCEFRRGHIAVFADRLEQGIWEFRYRLRATVPGRFAALPAIGEAMYVPKIRANSANRFTEITAAGESL